MSYTGVKDMVIEASDAGKTWYSSFRKVPAIASVQGNWIDLSMAPGIPRPNYYLGDEKTATRSIYLSSSGSFYGLQHGVNVSPDAKFLQKIGIFSGTAGVVPAVLTLCDYLIYYPLIDMDSDQAQDLTNTVNSVPVTLPRYADGAGVQAFLVATNPYVGNSTFTITYTNSNGVAGQVSRGMLSNASGYIGTIIHSGVTAGVSGAFINLCPGDVGIRSVQNIQFDTANGGLGCLVLCKPLATIYIRETATWCEFDFFLMQGRLPQIFDGAYLNFLCMPNGTVATVPILGDITCIWG